MNRGHTLVTWRTYTGFLDTRTRRNLAVAFICPLQQAQPPARLLLPGSPFQAAAPTGTASSPPLVSQVVWIFPGESATLLWPFSSNWFIEILRSLKLNPLSSQYPGARDWLSGMSPTPGLARLFASRCISSPTQPQLQLGFEA